ncbi:hypothetical protein QOT17_009520 [Balamuthia mandrillaris]
MMTKTTSLCVVLAAVCMLAILTPSCFAAKINVIVGENGDLTFAPRTVQASVGDEIEWLWASGGHDVVQTDGADSCTALPSQGFTTEGLQDVGHIYTYTIQEQDAGQTLHYMCTPHCQGGMTGSIEVRESGGDGGDSAGGKLSPGFSMLWA